MFAYKLTSLSTHPAAAWGRAAQRSQPAAEWSLRLAAMAGHMQIDKIAARRAALIDLLADGRFLTRTHAHSIKNCPKSATI